MVNLKQAAAGSAAMGWYVRPGMGSKKAMASRVGTGALRWATQVPFSLHMLRGRGMEGDGGVRTISTGRLSWLIFSLVWYVAVPTWDGGGLHG